MKKPLLTIAIPTYNRAKSLDLLLQSIGGQLIGLDDHDLEVLIFDNCSTDNTGEVAKSFSAKYSIIRYARNSENIGPDNNFVKAFNSAQGQYLWMLGDDELLFDGAIVWALKFCKEKEFGCVYLSSIPVVFDQIHHFLGQPIDALVKFKKFNSYQFAQAINYRITFLSGSIVNLKSLIESNPQINKDIEKYSKSNLVHLAWIFGSILSMPHSYYLATPIFAATIANSGGYSPVKVFIENLSEIFGHYFSLTNIQAKKFIRQITLIGWFPKVVFDIRFTDKYKSTGFKVEVEHFPQDVKQGINWFIFNSVVMNAPKLLSFFGMLYLKMLHKLTQHFLLVRGKKFVEHYGPYES